jgi:hypothetical protein
LGYKPYKNKEGKRVPGVTTVINKCLGWNKEALCGWTRKLALQGIDPRKVRDAAADTGTLTHKEIECFAKNDPDNEELTKMKKEASFEDIVIAKRGLEEYKEYEKLNQIETLEAEYRGVNEEYQFGYTIDKIATSIKGIGLLDYKTSKGVWADHIIQTSAYYKSVEEDFGLTYDELIHIRKDFEEDNESPVIKPVPIPLSLLKKGWDIFRYLREEYELKKEFDVFLKTINPEYKKKEK